MRVLLIVVLMTFLNLSAQAQLMRPTINIDATKSLNTWEGFGTSGCWWPMYIAEFPDDKRKELWDLLHSPRGINLSIYRYNIPAGGGEGDVTQVLRRTPSIRNDDGTIDINRDIHGIKMLREAYAAGVRKFVLFSNSPPTFLLKNGKASGGEKGVSNLKEGAETDFAKYVIEATRQIHAQLPGSEISLSPINEPQWFWGRDHRGQEGCHYEPEEVRRVLRALVLELDQQKLSYPVEGPESAEWKSSEPYFDAMMNDDVISKRITHLAVHSYWSNLADRKKIGAAVKAKYPQIKLIQSEYCQMEHGHNLTIESGLNLANTIYEDIQFGHVVSWQWWISIYVGGYCDALVYANPKTQLIEPTKRLWAMGNYSRFVEAGDEVIACGTTSDLRPLAFLSKDKKRLTLVVINRSTEPVAADLAIAGWKQGASRRWVTDAERDLAEDKTANDFAAKSVTTIDYRIAP